MLGVGLRPESLDGASLGFGRFLLPILGGSAGFQRMEKTVRDRGNLFNRSVEGRFVRLRRLVEPSDLPHELQGSGTHLLLGYRWFEIEECSNISTHFLQTSSWFRSL